jgi:flavin-dependent dehydrogenase
MGGQSQTTVPASTQILVIGGGPAGSYSSTLLAREGFEVTLLEKDVFPRYHIGESLLPSTRQFMSLIDAVHLIEDHGFAVKVLESLILHIVYHSPTLLAWCSGEAQST